MTQVSGDWLDEPATQKVCAVLEQGGAQALFVGGCVRNALLGVPVSDIDIATDALPDRVMELAKTAGIKAIPTGIEHGTVTLVVGGIPHEITTFRKDVETDGRRAVVAFSSTVEEDAARRDFTMNAIYARSDGAVLDPLNGLPDLNARKVRFIGSAETRIREDYLRSLRYFRFHAWYGDQSQGMDADAISAIAANLDGLENVSRERIGAELIKLLRAPDPAPAVAGMRSTGVLARILPGTDDRALAPLIHVEQQIGASHDPFVRLAALGDGDTIERLRLSRAQLRHLHQLRDCIGNGMGPAELAYRYQPDTAIAILMLRCALLESPWDATVAPLIDLGASAKFPITARDLMPGFSGAELGAKLSDLEHRWIASGFTLSRDELLA